MRCSVEPEGRREMQLSRYVTHYHLGRLCHRRDLAYLDEFCSQSRFQRGLLGWCFRVGRRVARELTPELSFHEFSHDVFVRVADHPGDAGKLRDLPWRALRVAAGDENLAAGVRAMDAANYLADLGVGGRSHRAGVEDCEIARFAALRLFQARFQQLAPQSNSVR